MSRILILFALGMAVAFTGPTWAESANVEKRYDVGGGKWSSDGVIAAVARVFERGGAAVVCGAWTTDHHPVLSAQLSEDVITAASLFIGETRVALNLSFIAREE